MAYVTVADLRSALNPEGATGAGTAAELTDTELNDAIVEAASEVDGRLRNRYTVPFPDGQVPPLVAVVTRDLAAYEATLRHRKSQPLSDDHPVRLRYDRARAILDQLASGKSEAEQIADDMVAVQNPYEGELFGPADFDLGPAPGRWPGYG